MVRKLPASWSAPVTLPKPRKSRAGKRSAINSAGAREKATQSDAQYRANEPQKAPEASREQPSVLHNTSSDDDEIYFEHLRSGPAEDRNIPSSTSEKINRSKLTPSHARPKPRSPINRRQNIPKASKNPASMAFGDGEPKVNADDDEDQIGPAFQPITPSPTARTSASHKHSPPAGFDHIGTIRTWLPGASNYQNHQTYPHEKLHFLRESNNTFDKNAIAAFNSTDDAVGYVSRRIAAVFADYMDSNTIFLTGEALGTRATLWGKKRGYSNLLINVFGEPGRVYRHKMEQAGLSFRERPDDSYGHETSEEE